MIVRSPLPRAELERLAEERFGDMVKGVVDVRRRILSLGEELHADEESELLQDGSRQQDLWGINLYPGRSDAAWIEFDSLINIRPSQGNRSRDVEDPDLRQRIRQVVESLIEA